MSIAAKGESERMRQMYRLAIKAKKNENHKDTRNHR